MTEPTIFDKIISGDIPAYIVWEDEQYMAFLTPFANTRGVTVVIPKANPGDYVFALDDAQIAGLMSASKKVARLLEKALDVKRVALVFEGEAVPHVHAKLYPMYNLEAERETPEKTFFNEYPGYITTQEGPEMDHEQLQEIQSKIKAAHHEN
jgi:histidine triad (HIT) family protein